MIRPESGGEKLAPDKANDIKARIMWIGEIAIIISM